jgi:glutathione S-transferase
MALALRFSPTSPYVRKVTVAAAERGLADRIARECSDPWDPAGDLPQDNPLGKVPALRLEDGATLYDSRVIVRYLDTLHDGPPLIPAEGAQRWRVERTEALADGILDAAVARLIEQRRRPAELFWAAWDAWQRDKIARGLDVLEQEAAALERDPPTLAEIAVACALGYLDFRFADDGWRRGRPALDAWYAAICARPALRETVPEVA